MCTDGKWLNVSQLLSYPNSRDANAFKDESYIFLKTLHILHVREMRYCKCGYLDKYMTIKLWPCVHNLQ